MPKLSYETMLEGLRHEDIFVRSGALAYLAVSGAGCRADTSQAAFDMVEKYGWDEGFVHPFFMTDLPMDAEMANRLISWLKNAGATQDDSTSEEQRFHEVCEWLSKAPPEVWNPVLNELDELASNASFESEFLDQFRFESALIDLDAEKCRTALDEEIKEMETGDDYTDDDVYRIEGIVKRLASLNAIDADEVLSWINQDAKLKNIFEPTPEDIKVCVGFEMAKQAGIPVPLERCLECLAPELPWLSNCAIAIIISMADESILDELLKRYPKMEDMQKLDLLQVFEKVQFPGREEKIRDLATLEQDLELRAHLGVVMSYYGTDQGIKYARETVESMDDEIEASDVIDVLYALRVLKGESSSELDEWRNILGEIHTVFSKLISGEIDPEQDDVDTYDDPRDPVIVPETDGPPPVETIQRESPKVRRNDLCPCGSGKKYKKCCINNAN